MERTFNITPMFKSLMDPIPDAKVMIANGLHQEFETLYPGIFIEVGTDYLKGVPKSFDQASLVFSLFRNVSVDEIRSMPNAFWLISLPSQEVLAYYQTQGIRHYDLINVNYRYATIEEKHLFITVKAES